MPYNGLEEMHGNIQNSQLPIKSMVVIGSNTSDKGQSCFPEDVHGSLKADG